ncbi:hypothetical protein T484DRAFT_1648706, partial [Baffinella frigidus]
EDTFCRKCKSPHDGGRMILCDGCDAGCHLYCASPALSTIPSGEWFCDKCVAARAPPLIPVLSPPREEGKRQIVNVARMKYGRDGCVKDTAGSVLVPPTASGIKETTKRPRGRPPLVKSMVPNPQTRSTLNLKP